MSTLGNPSKEAGEKGANSSKGNKSPKDGSAKAPASGTPVVSTEKAQKKCKSEGETSAAAAAIPKIPKFGKPESGISASTKTQEPKETWNEKSSESSEEGSIDELVTSKKLVDDGHVDPDFDGRNFGLPVNTYCFIE
jgi:hypothetical protein